MTETTPDAHEGANSGRPRRTSAQIVADIAVAAVIRSARLARGWKQKDMADKSDFGLTEKGYPKLDTGGQSITAAQFVHMCEILGMDPGASITRSQRLAAHLREIATEPLDARALMDESLEWLADNG